MSSGRTDMLAWAMQDRLHQPYREKLVPGLTEVMAAAMAAGSVGTALSGAGPAVLALCVQSKVKAIGTSMVETWKRNGIEARVLTLAPDRRGLLVDGQAEHNT
jgi:homoserine kinase